MSLRLAIVLCLRLVCQGQVHDTTIKVVCRGLDNAAYRAWISNEGLRFQSSADGGTSWGATAGIIAPVKGGWPLRVDGVLLDSAPSIACDTGKSQFRGRIYISWSDEKHGAGNKDVFLVYSDDRGETWTEPILVTYQPNHKEQFKPRLAIDQANGLVNLAYFDKQNYFSGALADVYLARSFNGGLKFEYFKLNRQPVAITAANPLTIDLQVPENQAPTISWTGMDRAKKEIRFRVQASDSLLRQYSRDVFVYGLQMERSFVFAPKMKLGFVCPANMVINVSITKPLEPGFEKTVVRNLKCRRGANTLLVDAKSLGLVKGNYVINFYYTNRYSFAWITEE